MRLLCEVLFGRFVSTEGGNEAVSMADASAWGEGRLTEGRREPTGAESWLEEGAGIKNLAFPIFYVIGW